MVKHKSFALKHFNPISAPATRKPCGETEPGFRLSMGFVPQVYVEKAGVRFGREWHENCEFRYDMLMKMKQYLHATFPKVPEFMPSINEKGFDEDCATLSGVYGSKVVAMTYGFDVQFPEDDWPGDVSNRPLPEEMLRNLAPFDPNNNPFMEKLEKQMDDMERCFGRIDGFLNYQGVLNTAQKIRGNNIFIDLLDDPEFAKELFSHIEDTLSKLAHRVQARQRASGVDIDLFSVSNCVVSMISPDMYGEFILPHDIALSKQFSRFGVHTCNWNVTPYMDKLAGIEKMGYLDMSAGSDLEKARRLFPDARLAIFFTPGDIERQPLEALEREFYRIARLVAPCDIIFADMTPKTDAGKLNALIDIAEKIAEKYV